MCSHFVYLMVTWHPSLTGFVAIAENLTPAELRKLKNKERKKAKKEALQKEKAKQDEQAKKEQKPKAADADLDGPKEEELLPEKLARVGRFSEVLRAC